MDMNTIIKIFKLNIKAYALPQLITFLSIFLFFFIDVFAIMTIARPDTYVNIAVSIAGTVFFITSFIYGMITFTSGYSNTIRWGISRRNYLVGTLLYHIVVAIGFVILMLIAQVEGYLNNLLYGSFARLKVDQIFPPVLSNPLLYIAAPLIITAICTILGTIALKLDSYVLGIIFTYSLLLFTVANSYLKEIKAFFDNTFIMDLSLTIKIVLAFILITTALTASIKFYLNHDIT